MRRQRQTPVIVEIDADGVRAIHCDDPEVRVVIVDYSWDDDVLVTCPFPSPGLLSCCPNRIREAATLVIQQPDLPRALPKEQTSVKR